MTLTATKFNELMDAMAKREAWAQPSEAAVIAAHHLTPGVDVVRALMSTGVPQSSATRQAAAALEVLGPRPADPVHTVRRALADAVHYLEHPDQAIPANRVRQLRQVAGVQLVEAGTGFDKGMAGSARAAAKWTDEEVTQVDDAIANVCNRLLAQGSEWEDDEVGAFTADDVWAELGPEFLVTKGLSGRLIAAANRGMIRSTGTTIISGRDGEHGHGQRLTLWEVIVA